MKRKERKGGEEAGEWKGKGREGKQYLSSGIGNLAAVSGK